MVATTNDLMKCAAAVTCIVVHISSHALTLCYDAGEHYPWIVNGGKGLNIHLIETVAAERGEKYFIRPLAWKDCLDNVKKGVIDGAFAATFSRENAQIAVFPILSGRLDNSKRLHTDGVTVLKIKGSRINWNGSKFANPDIPIGVQALHSINADLERIGATVDANTDTAETLVRRFGAGHFKAIALNTGQALKVMRNPFLAGKVETISLPQSERPYFIVFGHKYYESNRKKVEEIWTTVRKVRDSSAYQAIEAKYAVATEFAALHNKMTFAREVLVVMLVNRDKRDLAQQKLVKDSADEVSAQLDRMQAPLGKQSQFNELVATWNAFKKTRELDLVPAILRGDDSEARRIGGGIQKERIAKCLALALELDE